MKHAVIFFSILLFLAGCNHNSPLAEPATDEPEPIAVTRWSDRTELFMEYHPLVAGDSGRAAVHFTDARTFQPLTEGIVRITFAQNQRVVQSFRADGPSSPGIFGVDLKPQQPGTYLLSVILESPGLVDTHELGEVIVYSTPETVVTADAAPQEGVIPFLKEQQWTLDFATELAVAREIRESLRVAGEIRPRSGGEVEVIAPITGRIAPASRIPTIGSTVFAGQTLLSLIPHTPSAADLPTLQMELAESIAHLEYARLNRERAERLLAAGAVPGKRLQEAEEAETIVAARLKAAQARLEQYERTRSADGAPSDEFVFSVRAPIAGVIASIRATPGSNATQGESLFRIVAVDRVHVVAYVPEVEASRMGKLTGAEMELQGIQRRLPANRLVAVSRWIDPVSRTLSVIFEVDNSDRRLAIGQAFPVRLFLSQVSRALSVPESAVIDDGGRPVLFVQLEGESFSRRAVRLGARASGYVQILDGIRTGERVVTRGAYLIRLAALSETIPAHGHAH